MRLAELQVYTEFMNSDRAGRVLYEVKTSRNMPELDFAILLEDVAIYGAQVKVSRVASMPSTAASGSASPMTGSSPSRAR